MTQMAASEGGDVIALKRLSIINLDDDDDDDEFEPLFSYGQSVGPAPTFLSDDSDEEDIIITSAPKRKPGSAPAKGPSTLTLQKAPAQKVLLEDDDSWLTSSPPKLPKFPQPVFSTGNYAGNCVLQLREKRRELMMLQQEASPGAIKRVEELARMQAQQRPETLTMKTPESSKSHVEPAGGETASTVEKEKVLIKVQNKSGNSQSIRIFMTDKFEKLFSMYAKVVGASLPTLSFRFDGDQLSPSSTPKELDMEEGDTIEVYERSVSR